MNTDCFLEWLTIRLLDVGEGMDMCFPPHNFVIVYKIVNRSKSSNIFVFEHWQAENFSI